ncbi:hypothetical protein [Spiroplasma endosymbiont of Nebria brevicollis]|uniref:hypothetical protein n=1 Tax=Spiroplasma endosymbiont of Nebria brevicollis TaxID=3066284 RepID=UPI00313BB534
MKNELIKYWGKKCFFAISMLWLFSQIIFVIIAGILINSVDDKLINILVIVGINSLMLLIMFGFSVSIYTYETVYQIKTTGSTYETKLYRYLLILFGFGWLIFFISNALFMLINGAVYNIKLDYFDTLNQQLWKLIVLTSFNLIMMILHRQLMAYTLNHSSLPWSKWIDKK